jgi:phospholipase C
MQWTVEQVNAIVAGGLWGKTAIFITWDDWGGWSDHVTPSAVETWSHTKSQRVPDAHPEFDEQPFRYGSRVPCLVLSPYAKARHISKELNSHVSLVKFCQTLFGLPHLNARDGGSNGMADCFDFKQTPLPAPTP